MKDKSDRWSIWSEEVWANVGIVKLIPLRLPSHLTGDTWIDIATDKSVLRFSETDLLWVLKFSVKPSQRACYWTKLFRSFLDIITSTKKIPALCAAFISKQRISLFKVSLSSLDSVVSAHNLDFLLFIRLHINYWIVFAVVSVAFLFIPINNFRYWPSEHQN
jgi:hypothetical protein